MYIPPRYRESDRAVALAVIQNPGWGYLVGIADGRPMSDHLPFMVEGPEGEEKLVGHMARANPHWQTFEDGIEALVIFPGPHTYVSPNWYAAEMAVPTWNYVAVHVYGVPRIFDDRQEVYAAQKRLVDFHESGSDEPWRIEDLPDDYASGMLKAIVNFEIPIARIEAKFKLSQNRTADSRKGVIAALAKGEREDSRRIAELMAAREPVE